MHCRRPPVIGWTPNRPCMSNVTTSSGYPNAQKKMGHAFPTLGACQSPWCRWGGWRLPGGYRGRTARIQANQSPGVWKHLERDRERERERVRERDRRRLRWLAGSGAVVVAGNVPVRARISTHFRKVTYCEKLTFLVQIYFYTFISLHIPLKWKLPNPDLNKTQPPTINGMKSAPPKTYASSSSVGSCCCNVVRVWLLPLLGHPGRAGRHDHSITTSRCDTWQMRAPQIQLETSTRGSQTAASKRAGATRPNTWSPPPAPTTPRRAAAHSDGGGAGPRCR